MVIQAGLTQTDLSEFFTEIDKAVDAVEDRLAFVADPIELGQAVCDAAALKNRADALVSKLARAATNNLTPGAHGQRTIGQFVAARTGNQARDINRSYRLAVWLRDFPIFNNAHGKELTDTHLHYLRTKLDTSLDNHCYLTDWQQFFVDTAATCTFADFVTACEYWLIHVDPDGKEPADQIDTSTLSIRTGAGGRSTLAGSCDAVTGQMIRTAIDAEANKLRRDDQANGVDRTDGQRQMAALANLVGRGAARDDGTCPIPLVSIVMSESVAEWAADVLYQGRPTGNSVPVQPTDIDGRCELIDGTPIHPFLAVAALAGNLPGLNGAKIRRVVLDARGRALDVSYDSRSFPEWIRTTALIQSRGKCATHGCDAPHAWLETDHVDPHSHGGATRLDNAQPQCGPDNQAKGASTGHIPWLDTSAPPRHQTGDPSG